MSILEQKKAANDFLDQIEADAVNSVLKPVSEPKNAPEMPKTARHWTSRRFGECAFPVSGVGADTFSCCAKAVVGGYCAHHAKIMFPIPEGRPKAA